MMFSVFPFIYNSFSIIKYFIYDNTQLLSICQYSAFEYANIFTNYNGGFVEMDYRTRMRNIREDRDLTQKQVGEIINKSQQGYNHIETGRAELKIEDLVKLCQFYNVSADYFIGLTDQE